MKRRVQGFSLVEVLAACAVLSTAALTVTATWSLADRQALATRLENRARRLLRETYELQSFAPPDQRPFAKDGTSAGNSTLLAGFLYHPWAHGAGTADADRQPQNSVPYRIEMTPDGRSLQISYDIPGLGTGQPRSVTRSMDLPDDGG